MNVLGISCYYHDAAACLIRDGHVVAAAEEERFSRRKHDPGLPRLATAYVLSAAGLAPREIDHVVFYEKPLVKFERIVSTAVDTFPAGIDQFVPAMRTWLREKLWVPGLIRQMLPGFTGKILYAEHHVSHAASAYYASPFEDSAVLTMDGIGEWASTTIGHGYGLDLDVTREIRFPYSVGLLYSAFTAYLGHEINEGEYKVMGMAAYGTPRYVDKVRRLISANPDGSYALDLRFLGYHRSLRAWSRAFEDLFGAPCVPSDTDPLDERCADIAASVQAVTEELVLGLALEAHRLTGSRNLCLAGGVAQNVLANRRVLLETPFERVFVPPAPGDSGGALGCAAYAYHAVLRGARIPTEVGAATYVGPEYADAEIRDLLTSRGIAHRELSWDAVPGIVADMIADDKVIGWFQGRMEFGPRALGSRSILANARNPRMKEILNTKIKHREPFRPFAPSVTIEDAGRYFADPVDSPFMSFVSTVRPEARGMIPAVTHVDGTARVQTVSPAANPLYHRLLREVEARTGVPIVVNTSFNVRGEPIVCSPADAFRSFSHTEMDALVLGRFVVGPDAKRLDEPYPGAAKVHSDPTPQLS